MKDVEGSRGNASFYMIYKKYGKDGLHPKNFIIEKQNFAIGFQI